MPFGKRDGEPRAAEVRPVTDKKFRSKVDSIVRFLASEFKVEGKEKIMAALERDPKAKFLIASSHFSNLDAPAAVQALGDILDIQIIFDRRHLGATPQNLMYKIAGRDHFTDLESTKFDIDSLGVIIRQIKAGKTPWIAAHTFTTAEEMEAARVGFVYLAHKSGAKIIPTALDYRGGSTSLEGGVNILKGIRSRRRGEAPANYHVGEPIELPPLDVAIIERVLAKRKQGEAISDDEITQFGAARRALKAQADEVARKIASMLPEDRRGAYKQTS